MASLLGVQFAGRNWPLAHVPNWLPLRPEMEGLHIPDRGGKASPRAVALLNIRVTVACQGPLLTRSLSQHGSFLVRNSAQSILLLENQRKLCSVEVLSVFALEHLPVSIEHGTKASRQDTNTADYEGY